MLSLDPEDYASLFSGDADLVLENATITEDANGIVRLEPGFTSFLQTHNSVEKRVVVSEQSSEPKLLFTEGEGSVFACKYITAHPIYQLRK